MTDQTSDATEHAEDTAPVESVETQETPPQGDSQADTTADTSVGDSMKIEAKEESEDSSEASEPTIDDIVSEALSGELSEETQKLIEDNGLGKHIDMLVEGHKAIQERNNQEVFSVVGGQESYAELQEWGKNNMSKEEQKSYNDALFSGDMNLVKLAVQGLNARYVASNGKEPSKVIEGGGTSNEENRPFSNQMEYLKVTQTLQYKQNPEFRRSVEAKRSKSGF